MWIKTILLGGEGLSPKQEKFRKIFMYLVSGGITTVVNWVSYILFDKLIANPMMVNMFGHDISLKTVINQIVCWILAVLTAYIINRIFVFRSKGNWFRELMTFVGARILSFLVLELALYMVMIKACEGITGVPVATVMFMIASFGFTYEYLVKGINSIFVVIANYVMSKLMVFRKEDMVDYTSSGKEETDG
ncbi:MAG: GtrA family protein [Saccharofermentans sp.]|nr:GtrA family protein [Saccharofermentans sp.]